MEDCVPNRASPDSKLADTKEIMRLLRITKAADNVCVTRTGLQSRGVGDPTDFLI
jgi:hypothetical protein